MESSKRGLAQRGGYEDFSKSFKLKMMKVEYESLRKKLAKEEKELELAKKESERSIKLHTNKILLKKADYQKEVSKKTQLLKSVRSQRTLSDLESIKKGLQQGSRLASVGKSRGLIKKVTEFREEPAPLQFHCDEDSVFYSRGRQIMMGQIVNGAYSASLLMQLPQQIASFVVSKDEFVTLSKNGTLRTSKELVKPVKSKFTRLLPLDYEFVLAVGGEGKPSLRNCDSLLEVQALDTAGTRLQQAHLPLNQISNEIILCEQSGVVTLFDIEQNKAVMSTHQLMTLLCSEYVPGHGIFYGGSEDFLRQWDLRCKHPQGIPIASRVEGLCVSRGSLMVSTSKGLLGVDLRSWEASLEEEEPGLRLFGQKLLSNQSIPFFAQQSKHCSFKLIQLNS